MNTVFVIGAGASAEAKLPTGEGLKKEIAELLDIRFEGRQLISGDRVIEQAIRHANKVHGGIIYDDAIKAAWHIRDALPLAMSIDNFIDAHRENINIKFCSKLAIVKAVLSAECNSLLHFKNDGEENTINLNALEDKWYLRFFHMITENCDFSDLKKRLSLVKLIIFNYDRCVEHFLYHAFIRHYQVSEEESRDLILKMKIYHPYGSIGDLPWVRHGHGLSFGSGITPDQLLSLSQHIKTFTEGVDLSSNEVDGIKKTMAKAERVAFIGFAFHQLNMELIAPKATMLWQWQPPKCFASTFDVSKSDQEVIQNQIRLIYGDEELDVMMSDIKCNGFFKEFWKSLSFD